MYQGIRSISPRHFIFYSFLLCRKSILYLWSSISRLIRLIYYFMFLNTNETNLRIVSIQNNSEYRNVFLLSWYFLLIQYAWHNIHSFCSFCAHLFYEKQKKSTINRFARTKCCHAVTNSNTRYFSFHQNVVLLSTLFWQNNYLRYKKLHERILQSSASK